MDLNKGRLKSSPEHSKAWARSFHATIFIPRTSSFAFFRNRRPGARTIETECYTCAMHCGIDEAIGIQMMIGILWKVWV